MASGETESDELRQLLSSGEEAVATEVSTTEDKSVGAQPQYSDLTLGELDFTSDEVELAGLVEELELWGDHEVVRGILSKGSDVRGHVREVDAKLREVELDSIQDYIAASDNLVSLHEQIKTCDGILEDMEDLLGGFQGDLGNISTEIKTLQEQSLSMSIKLRNRKAAEAQLGAFVEGLTVPPRLVTEILDKEVNEDYLEFCLALHTKLTFTSTNPLARKAVATQDVEPELERLRVKAVTRVRDFMLQKFHLLRKPKTNIQIMQQSVLLKYKNFVQFLRDHGPETFPEVRAAYVDTMSRIYRGAIAGYVGNLARIQTEIATRNDLIASEELSVVSIFARNTAALRNRPSVFALGGRALVLNNLDQAPPLVIHSVVASGQKHPYEALCRSSNKLLMDAASAEYLFCHDFWKNDRALFGDIFDSALQVMEENLATALPQCYDAIGLLLMIRINHEHQVIMQRRRVPCLDNYLDKVNIMVWPRLKVVVDLHVESLQQAQVRTLWGGGEELHAHYVARRYAEFTASLLQLNADYGESQVDAIIERLRGAACQLLLRLGALYVDSRKQLIFLINNYDMVLTVLKEAGLGSEGGMDRTNTYSHFEELLSAQTYMFVEEELASHFRPLIQFVKKAEAVQQQQQQQGRSEAGEALTVSVGEARALVRDFADRWKLAIEQMHKDAITNFGNLQRGMEILQRTLSQLLIYYTRLTGSEGVLMKCGPEGAALCKEAISHPAFIYEIKNKLKL